MPFFRLNGTVIPSSSTIRSRQVTLVFQVRDIDDLHVVWIAHPDAVGAFAALSKTVLARSRGRPEALFP